MTLEQLIKIMDSSGLLAGEADAAVAKLRQQLHLREGEDMHLIDGFVKNDLKELLSAVQESAAARAAVDASERSEDSSKLPRVAISALEFQARKQESAAYDIRRKYGFAH